MSGTWSFAPKPQLRGFDKFFWNWFSIYLQRQGYLLLLDFPSWCSTSFIWKLKPFPIHLGQNAFFASSHLGVSGGLYLAWLSLGHLNLFQLTGMCQRQEIWWEHAKVGYDIITFCKSQRLWIRGIVCHILNRHSWSLKSGHLDQLKYCFCIK